MPRIESKIIGRGQPCGLIKNQNESAIPSVKENMELAQEDVSKEPKDPAPKAPRSKSGLSYSHDLRSGRK